MNKELSSYFKIIKLIKNISPAILPVVIIKAIIDAALPYVSIYFGYLILEGLISSSPASEIYNYLYWFVGIFALLRIISFYTNKVVRVLRNKVELEVMSRIANKSLTMDYEVFEKQETLKMLQAAESGANSNGRMVAFIVDTSNIIKHIFSFIYVIILLVELFTTNITVVTSNLFEAFIVSPYSIILIILFIFLTIYISSGVFKSFQNQRYNLFKSALEINRRSLYFFDVVIENYHYGKDFRIYNMHDMIINKLRKYYTLSNKTLYAAGKAQAKCSVKMILVEYAVIIFAYIIIGLKALLGAISIAAMIKFITVLTSLNLIFKGFIQSYASIRVMMKYMKNYVIYLELENVKYQGELPVEKRDDYDYKIEFKNVCFKYPNSQDYVLKDINTELSLGKKHAIVGRNGAGKTTFIKLLCRLYDPTKGEILLNGINIRKYDYDEYLRILAVVFQDFKLYSMSVGENIAVSTDYNEEKVLESLSKIGMKDKILNTKNGINTAIFQIDELGQEFSGGEMQKIAIARALYKESPLVILDEPTSALDPKSEYEVYKLFDNVIKEKTSIYISHRMASCRFCDTIMVFEEGKIIQTGSHEKLIEEDNIYSKLWNAQAKYYV
jgi:ATP-binding cassette subfamily B protein